MARWYKDKIIDNIDVGQAVRDAGKIGEAVSFLGQGMKTYGDQKYNKKRAKIEDVQKDDTLKMKKYTADKGYSGKVDSANIRAGAADRATSASLKVAGINFDKEKYKSDSSYRQAIDKEVLANKGKKISAGATLGAAKVRQSSAKYTADRGVENNIRSTSATNNQTSAGIENNKRTNKAKARKKLKLNMDDFTYSDLKLKARKDLE